MTQKLVPVQRRDKNGHMVTRWVRPDGSTGNRSSIPPVQATHSPEIRKAATDLITDAAENGNYENTSLKPLASLLHNMRELSDETLSEYCEAEAEEPNKYHAHLLLSALNNKDSDTKTRSLLQIAKLDKQIDPEWSDSVNGSYHYDSAKKALAGLHMYKWSGFTPPRDLGKIFNPKVQQALALVTVAYRMWEFGMEEEEHDGTIAIQDGNLVSLILDHPEKAEEIASIAHFAGSKDGKLIKFIMDHESPDEVIETVRSTSIYDVDHLREMLATSSSSLRSGAL